MKPKKNGGGAGHHPATPAKKIAAAARPPQISSEGTDQHRRRRDRLVAVGEFHPPCGRRGLGAVIVRRCPACQYLHIHRAMLVRTVDGSERTGSCGVTYIVRVLPAQRIEGAA